jgi:hypothetical protein
MNKYKCKLVITGVEITKGTPNETKERPYTKMNVEKDIVLPFVPFIDIVIDGIGYSSCDYYTETNTFVLTSYNFHALKYIPKGFTEIVKEDK